MLVMILEKAPESLRGELSRWLIQPKTGIFVGNPSRRVRDELWMKACRKIKDGNLIQIWTTRGEPGFDYRQVGNSPQTFLDFDGLPLITTFKAPRRCATPEIPPPTES